jgi:hypothetical protein
MRRTPTVIGSGDDGLMVTWIGYGIDGGCIGFDARQRFFAQIVWYDAPEPGWVAFVRHERLDGRWEAAEGAVAATEAVLAGGGGSGDRSRGRWGF